MNARRLLTGLALALGCRGATEVDEAPDCERSAYELERTRYRCTSEGELQGSRWEPEPEMH
jgi:hypothetical protein